MTLSKMMVSYAPTADCSHLGDSRFRASPHMHGQALRIEWELPQTEGTEELPNERMSHQGMEGEGLGRVRSLDSCRVQVRPKTGRMEGRKYYG